MKIRYLLGFVPAIAVLGTTPAEAKSTALSSRYTNLSGCKVAAHGDPEAEHGGDWILNRCKGFGGIPVWLGFVDGNQSAFGFGKQPNVSGIFEIDRPAAPIEWRGRLVNGQFTPFAAIIRVQVPTLTEGKSASVLEVYRLRADGTSCMVGDSQYSNVNARKLADGSVDGFTCSGEPDVLTLPTSRERR
jgi:hypothetical protein